MTRELSSHVAETSINPRAIESILPGNTSIFSKPHWLITTISGDRFKIERSNDADATVKRLRTRMLGDVR